MRALTPQSTWIVGLRMALMSRVIPHCALPSRTSSSEGAAGPSGPRCALSTHSASSPTPLRSSVCAVVTWRLRGSLPDGSGFGAGLSDAPWGSLEALISSLLGDSRSRCFPLTGSLTHTEREGEVLGDVHVVMMTVVRYTRTNHHRIHTNTNITNTHMQTRMHARTRAHTHAHTIITYTQTPSSHTHKHRYQVHTHTHIHTHTHTHAHTNITYTHRPSSLCTQSRKHTHILSHTNTLFSLSRISVIPSLP